MASIVFLGSGPVAAASLEFLSKHFTVEAVITKAKAPHHKTAAPVETLAENLHLPTLFANNKDELDKLFDHRHFQSRLGVIVDHGIIVSQKIIDAFELGIINSHFSLLPEWRGADPITFSLLSGQSKTGVSLMLIEPTLDTGKLLVQKSLAINYDDTITSLTTELVHLSNQLLAEYIPRYLDGSIQPKNQPHPDRATYSRKLTKSDGIIEWNKPADQIEREIRAYQGWPQSRTTIKGIDIIITRAHAIPGDTSQPGVITTIDEAGSGVLMIGSSAGYLCIEGIKPVGKKEMSVSEFLNGYRAKFKND